MQNFKFQISNLRLAIISLLVVIFLAGCGKKNEPAAVQNKEDPFVRIISMAPNLTEILFALGLDEEIVGVTKYSTYPPQALKKTNVGTFWQPDIEAVLKCRPTLVITLAFSQQTALAQRLKQIGCETLTVNIETVEQLYAAIEAIASKVERLSEGQALVQQLKQRRQQYIADHTDRHRPRVLWVIQREPLRVAGRNTFVNELIEIAGGVNAVGETIHQYPPISTEEILSSAPEIIIEPVMDPAQSETQRSTAEEFYKRFVSIPAVENERIYVINGDVVSRLGPRLDEALRMISECVWEQ